MLAPFTVADLLLFALPTEIALAPDGRRVAFTLLTQNAATNTRQSALWLLDLALPEQPPRQFTAGSHRDRQPAWSHDGRWLAFISDRADGSQIWIMPADGGEARPITALSNGAAHPLWSPDGQAILFQSAVRDGIDPLAVKDDETPRDNADHLRHVTRLQYRWDGGDILDGRTHLWLVDLRDMLAGTSTTPPTPRQITSGDYDHTEAAWSPDGAQIAFVSDRNDDRDANKVNDVWVLTLATGELARLSAGNSDCGKPTWSPDGSLVVWYDQVDAPGHTISNTHMMVAAKMNGAGWQAGHDLLAGEELSVGQGINTDLGAIASNPPTWSLDGAWIFAPVCQRGTVQIWRVPVTGGVAEALTNVQAQIGEFVLTQDHLIAIVTDALHPPEIARFNLANLPIDAADRWLTNVNPWLRERAIAIPQAFTFAAPDGWEIEGWVLLPPDAERTASDESRLPSILHIHGGPHGFYGPTFMGNLQAFAGAGYAVVLINPRGSIGYGEAFARACDADWGGADYVDVLTGIDAALARFPLDPARLAVTGTSYGGYMTNWIIGHTDRFKAAVSINSVSNLISSFGTSDVDSVFGVAEQGGTPWERQAFYIERSPITYAPNITTPTRVIGAERDWRCPIEQSEQLFTALKMLGRAPTDFIRVPGASHSINSGTPRQRVAQRQAILEWIQQYVPVDEK